MKRSGIAVRWSALLGGLCYSQTTLYKYPECPGNSYLPLFLQQYSKIAA
jgi:hypothetical protein